MPHLPHAPRFRRTILSIVLAVAFVAGMGARIVEAEDGLTPVAECVIVNGDGSFTAFFGYRNSSGETQTVTGGDNRVSGGSSSGAPQTFVPGRIVAAFSVTSNGTKISWILDGSAITVTPSYRPCSTNPSVPEAPVALALMVAPAAMTGWWVHRRRPRPC